MKHHVKFLKFLNIDPFFLHAVLQDVVDLKLSEKSTEWQNQWMQLKALNRMEILMSDLENIDAPKCVTNPEAAVVCNGLNPEKTVSQIPYLKGYFFLYRVSSIVGSDNFLTSLKKYVERFHGTLISTNQCVTFYCHQHGQHEDLIRQAAHFWLYTDQLPDQSVVGNLHSNSLYNEVEAHSRFWTMQMQQKDHRNDTIALPHSPARPDQLIALFDRLLKLAYPVPGFIIESLFDIYQPNTVNATVYHRFCEIVVSGSHTRLLPLISQFLLDHTSMGAYIYGELMISEVAKFQSLARRIYKELEPFLEQSFKTVVREIVEPC